ncbi:MAG TPA: TolC family protein [Puia sp.]|uniref:TolC family protein n=1 Tax=Puia sp. TaxID=2045100 RepID=UPI002C2EA7E2|nr:TolC family protein [Puia sp.]HVU97001.1 TolC family protein [Puia sp.]
MSKKLLFCLAWVLGATLGTGRTQAQVLTMRQAVQNALNNYGTIRAKANYVKASQANVREAKREYLPDINFGIQQDYGTVASAYGPSAPSKVASVSSSGPVFPTQNWNAAFGALYLTNVNWDFFQFGKARERTMVAQRVLNRDLSDLDQERFQQGIRVSAAYLQLVATQKLVISQQRNLARADTFLTVVTARVRSGLNPGVDSSLAKAEVSSARIALTNAIEAEQEQANALAQLMQVAAPDSNNFTLDSIFVSRIPASLAKAPAQPLTEHPLLKFFQDRVNVSDEQAKYLKTFQYPSFSLFGIGQDRGSGFSYNYGPANPNAFTQNYLKGTGFGAANYLVGVGVTWNLTTPIRVHQQIVAQKYTSEGLKEEYGLISQELQAQTILAESRIKNALANYREAPIQVKAASDAYLQKETLYRNGLATIVDVTTAAFVLNQAETQLDVIDTNVWQALLFKAAGTGDFGLFINEF